MTRSSLNIHILLFQPPRRKCIIYRIVHMYIYGYWLFLLMFNVTPYTMWSEFVRTSCPTLWLPSIIIIIIDAHIMFGFSLLEVVKWKHFPFHLLVFFSYLNFAMCVISNIETCWTRSKVFMGLRQFQCDFQQAEWLNLIWSVFLFFF